MQSNVSVALESYYARERETLTTEPAVRAELRGLGIASVHAEYDGVGDSGQIEQISYRDGSDPAKPVEVDEQTGERVEALLYALLELRHGGWENNDGACGTFSWDLVEGTLEHVHNQRYTDCDTSTHEGFGVAAGDLP